MLVRVVVYKKSDLFICVKSPIGLRIPRSLRISSFCYYCFKMAQIQIFFCIGYRYTEITIFAARVNTPMGLQVYRSYNFLLRVFQEKVACISKKSMLLLFSVDKITGNRAIQQ